LGVNIFIATILNQTATLTSEESWHCAKVLRNKVGDKIKLIDGLGNFYEASLSLVHEKKCEAVITQGPLSQTKHNYYLHLAIAPTKNIDRIEWLVEKAVEIGIDEISFVICKNSERTIIKTDRIRKIVESAVKQSLQAFIPKVNEVLDFKNVVESTNYDQKLIAHCFEEEKSLIHSIPFKNSKTLVLIGPEGDFTQNEVELAKAEGFKSLSLGVNRLRTETAGLYVCQAASILSA
jgi:16S rRNA (uracil1498-N3)-methyltransferase